MAKTFKDFVTADILGAEYWDTTRKLWTKVVTVTNDGHVTLQYANGGTLKTTVEDLKSKKFRKG